MKSINSIPKAERHNRIQFAVGMAAIDGGKPSAFTQKLLNQYENGEISSSHLKKMIFDKYAKDII